VSGKSGTAKSGMGKNSKGVNGTSNGTNSKVGKNGTFSLLGFGVGCLGWGFRFGV